MNARRRGGEQVIDRVQIREEAIHSDGNRPIREETTNPFNESVMETKHQQLSEKTLVPNAIKGLGLNSVFIGRHKM